MTYNYTIGPVDTDSISFCKPDGTPFSQEEIDKLMKEINDISPEFMIWENDGYYKKVIASRAKNYILWDGNKITIKGSAFKSSTLEIALKEFLNEMIDAMLHDRNNFDEIYIKYVKEILDIKDIKRWASKKTISSKTLTSERKNETRIKDTITDTDYREGDKIYVFFKENGELSLIEKFDGDYNKDKMLLKLYKATERFETILPVKELFVNYSLKKNKKLLEEIEGYICI